MPVDFQKVRSQVRLIGQSAPADQKKWLEKYEAARGMLGYHARNHTWLRERVQRAARLDPFLRCALPTAQPLDASYPVPALPDNVTLIAADGSQIYPDRHAEVLFYLLNVGALEVRPGQSPRPHYDTRLYYGEELYLSGGGLISDGIVNLQRDRWEREVLVDLAENAPQPVVTLTDGPIELWGQTSDNNTTFTKSLQSYLQALRSLRDIGAITAGYVDKPRADLVVQMLEVAEAADHELGALRQNRPLKGITDAQLYRSILDPGARSAVFRIQSKSAANYSGDLALHFFYLNVGRPQRPWLARVEIPAWVAEEADRLNTLHAVLVQQCGILGARPYPYLLHRAHEIAVVSLDEKKQIAQMLLLELRRQGVEVGEVSSKQSLKSAGGRARYGAFE